MENFLVRTPMHVTHLTVIDPYKFVVVVVVVVVVVTGALSQSKPVFTTAGVRHHLLPDSVASHSVVLDGQVAASLQAVLVSVDPRQCHVVGEQPAGVVDHSQVETIGRPDCRNIRSYSDNNN